MGGGAKGPKAMGRSEGEVIRRRGGEEGWPVATVDPASHRKGLGEVRFYP